jgi:hypothetical protein
MADGLKALRGSRHSGARDFLPMLKAHKKRNHKLADLLWPEFVVMRGCFFLKFQYEANPHLFYASFPTQSESEINHTHILDYFQHSAGIQKDPFFNLAHPDFLRACEIGKAVCGLWASKLLNDFPKEDFCIYYHGLDPIVRFHKIRKRTANWTEAKYFPKEIKNGEIVILDTRILRKQKARAVR